MQNREQWKTAIWKVGTWHKAAYDKLKNVSKPHNLISFILYFQNNSSCWTSRRLAIQSINYSISAWTFTPFRRAFHQISIAKKSWAATDIETDPKSSYKRQKVIIFCFMLQENCSALLFYWGRCRRKAEMTNFENLGWLFTNCKT